MKDGKDYLDFEISRETVREWLLTIYRLTGVDDLDSAVTFAYHLASTEDERRVVYTVAEIIRREASGDIRPPLDIYRMYVELVRGR